MSSFEKFGLRKQLHNAIEDLGFKTPTPIQDQSFSVILFLTVGKSIKEHVLFVKLPVRTRRIQEFRMVQ